MEAAMIEEAIEIRTSDGIADGFLYRADGAGKLPGAIHLTDIGGIRPSHREMAKRLADKGYTGAGAKVFFITAKPPLIDIKIGMGDPRTRQRFGELRASMTPDAVERDGTAYVNFLAAHSSVSAAPIGVVGYCFTGAMAMRTAARCRAKLPLSPHSTAAVSTATSRPARICCCRESRRASTSDTQPTTAACRPRRSQSSIARSPRGAANTRAKCTKAPFTAGRCRTRRFTTRRRPIARSTSSPGCSRAR